MASLWDFLFGKKEKTAAVAKGRLLFAIAHERANRDQPDEFIRLRAALLELIATYVKTDPHAVQVQRERQDNADILNIVLPEAPSDSPSVEPPADPKRSWSDLWFGKKRASADIAKERLMIMIAKDGAVRQQDYFAKLEEAVIRLVSEHLAVDPMTIRVHRDQQEGCEILNVFLPETPSR